MNMLNNMLSSRQSMVFIAIVKICRGMTDDVILKITKNTKLDDDTIQRIKNVLVDTTSRW